MNNRDVVVRYALVANGIVVLCDLLISRLRQFLARIKGRHLDRDYLEYEFRSANFRINPDQFYNLFPVVARELS